MKCIQIYKNGTMDEFNIKCNKNLMKNLMKGSKSQGEGDIKELYKWSYENKIIKCYGWYDGDAGFENKHDLPPGGISSFIDEDSSVQLLYGDIFLVYYDRDDKIIDFQISDYGVFYNLIFEGFDDCESETEDSNYSEDNDSDYNENNQLTDEEYEILSETSENLEIDTNEY
tara:strand:- start:538 stop:1050 length:513 start_codon:yes stop_codon:yes gene_type:complete